MIKGIFQAETKKRATRCHLETEVEKSNPTGLSARLPDS